MVRRQTLLFRPHLPGRGRHHQRTTMLAYDCQVCFLFRSPRLPFPQVPIAPSSLRWSNGYALTFLPCCFIHVGWVFYFRVCYFLLVFVEIREFSLPFLPIGIFPWGGLPFA